MNASLVAYAGSSLAVARLVFFVLVVAVMVLDVASGRGGQCGIHFRLAESASSLG